MTLENKICRTASCPALGDWAIKNKLNVKWGYAKRGDLILFDFNKNGTSDHIGIVTDVHQNYVETIEANTGGGSETNGDGVYRKERERGVTNYFVRTKLTDNEIEALIKTAEGELGYTEGKNNDNKYGRWYGANHEPYCCIFVVWCFAHTEVKKMETYKGTLPTLSRKVKIGQAKHDERGKLRGGKVGDQTGHEVSVDNYTYNKKKGKWNHWVFVARPKSEKAAKQMAKEMTEICNSPKVGYNQAPKGGRSALYRALKKAHWSVQKIRKVDTSCTPLVCACCRSVGIPIETGISAGSLKKVIKKTGDFTIYTTSDWTASSKKLKAGDILNSGKHSAMVVSVSGAQLKKGDSSADVILWQKFLKWYGFDCKCDGEFGVKTEGFTKNFQYENGITADGVAGNQTLSKARAVKK